MSSLSAPESAMTRRIRFSRWNLLALPFIALPIGLAGWLALTLSTGDPGSLGWWLMAAIALAAAWFGCFCLRSLLLGWDLPPDERTLIARTPLGPRRISPETVRSFGYLTITAGGIDNPMLLIRLREPLGRALPLALDAGALRRRAPGAGEVALRLSALLAARPDLRADRRWRERGWSARVGRARRRD